MITKTNIKTKSGQPIQFTTIQLAKEFTSKMAQIKSETRALRAEYEKLKQTKI